MKVTGVEWMGSIPDNWKEYRLKEVVSIQNGREIEVELDEGIPVYGSGGMFKYTDKYLYDGESVLLGRKGTIDSPQYVQGKFWTVDTSYYTVVNEDKLLTKLFYYMCQCFDYQYFQTGSTLPSMTQMDLGSIRLPITSIIEQYAITNFLNDKVGKMDRVIGLLEKKIITLETYKKMLIFEVVTKGVTHNIELKDSGIDWIGKIPNEWKVTKLKYEFDEIGSGTTPTSGSPIYYDGEYNWIQSGDLHQHYLTKTLKTITKLSISEFSALKFYNNEFIALAMYGASIANLTISQVDAYVNQSICVLGKSKGDLHYYYYLLFSAKDEILLQGQGGTQPNVSQEKIKKLDIIAPPIKEQKAIANFLDDKVGTLEQAIEMLIQEKNILKEVRKSFIFEYVTGKKRINV
jgi:type I restriction enzyme S subunit